MWFFNSRSYSSLVKIACSRSTSQPALRVLPEGHWRDRGFRCGGGPLVAADVGAFVSEPHISSAPGLKGQRVTVAGFRGVDLPVRAGVAGRYRPEGSLRMLPKLALRGLLLAAIGWIPLLVNGLPCQIRARSAGFLWYPVSTRGCYSRVTFAQLTDSAGRVPDVSADEIADARREAWGDLADVQ